MKQVLIAIDQLANALAGGYADETISARAYRKGWNLRQKLINALFIDGNHCRDSYYSELLRTQFPASYRSLNARTDFINRRRR